MKNIPIQDVISSIAASELLGVSEQRVRTLLRSGAIEGKQIGKQWITTDAAVNTYKLAGALPHTEDRARAAGPLPELKALSFFSGAMGLDQGLEKAGIHLLMACEFDKACRRTITANRPEIGLLGDIWKYSTDDIRAAAGLKTRTILTSSSVAHRVKHSRLLVRGAGSRMLVGMRSCAISKLFWNCDRNFA